MGKSTNGPDVTDVCMFVAEVQRQQQCEITMLLEFDGSGLRPLVYVHVLGTPKGNLPGSKDGIVAATGKYPHREWATFEGMLFALVARLDALYGQDDFLATIGLKER